MVQCLLSYQVGAIRYRFQLKSGRQVVLGMPISCTRSKAYLSMDLPVTLQHNSARRMKLRSLQTILVAMGQSSDTLQSQVMNQALVAGKGGGQSGRRPALCRSRFRTRVFSLPFWAYQGMYLTTQSSTAILPYSTRAMTQERVAVTLVSEAMSNMVSLVMRGEPKGRSLWDRWPQGQARRVWVPLATLRTAPVNAPSLRQWLTSSLTLLQS